MSPEWRLNTGFGTQKNWPFPLNKGVPSIEVIGTKIMWVFFRDQILCPLNGGVPWIEVTVPKETFHCGFLHVISEQKYLKLSWVQQNVKKCSLQKCIYFTLMTEFSSNNNPNQITSYEVTKFYQDAIGIDFSPLVTVSKIRLKRIIKQFAF